MPLLRKSQNSCWPSGHPLMILKIARSRGFIAWVRPLVHYVPGCLPQFATLPLRFWSVRPSAHLIEDAQDGGGLPSTIPSHCEWLPIQRLMPGGSGWGI